MKVNTKNTSNITVTRAHQFDDGSITFDMEVNEVKIYGCRLVDVKNGKFVSFPSRKGKDGNYYSYAFYKLTNDDTANIVAQIEAM